MAGFSAVSLTKFAVPPNATATLRLPAESAKRITEGGRRLRKVPGVSGLAQREGRVQLELASGTYEFRVE